jgi:hypothetical protein
VKDRTIGLATEFGSDLIFPCTNERRADHFCGSAKRWDAWMGSFTGRLPPREALTGDIWTAFRAMLRTAHEIQLQLCRPRQGGLPR